MAGETTDVIATPTTTSAGTTGTTTGGDIAGKPSGVESSLSNWAGPYVTEMMGRGQAIASTPYQAYTGPLTAGPSGLQEQAWSGIAGLQVPASIGQAATTAGQAASQAMGSTYAPTTFNNVYAAPSNYVSGQFSTGYAAPSAYSPTDITTGKYTDVGIAQQYMNPYVQTALNPQIAEARRQAEIENLKNKAAATRAGAYGGTRGALMESENQRNLLQNLANITGTGYKTAYEQGQQAYTSDQARALQAAQANEAAKQFGYGQQMTAAQLAAQYGLDAQKAAEASRQFGYGQQMTAAQLAAQYGLDAQKAAEASKQFGASYGLQGLQSAIQAAQAQGQLGTALSQQQRENLAAQQAAGATQRDIEQQGIAADYAQFQEASDYPYKQVQYMQSLLQGLPLAAQSYSYAQPSTLSNILGSASGIADLYKRLFGGSSGTTGNTGTTTTPK